MKSSNRDKAEGSARDLKGKVRAGAGKATGNRSMENRGRADQAEGRFQRKVGDVKKVFDK